MDTVIQGAARLCMYTFILTNLFGAGLGLTVREIIEPVRNLASVLKALIVNFILIPAMAYFLAGLLGADPSLKTGILIIACCAGEGFLPKLITIAKGDLAHAISFMALMMISTVIIVPVVLPVVIPGLAISPFSIAQHLVILMLVPLALGLSINAAKPVISKAIEPYVLKISSVSLLAAGILIVVLDYPLIISAWGTGVYKTAALFTLLAVSIGFLLGGPGKKQRTVNGFGSGARNVAAALLIAGSFSEPRIMTTVLISGLVMFAVLILSAFIYGRYQR